MYTIQKITNDPRQSQTVILPDGTSFFLSIYFRPLQYGWFIDRLVYEEFVLQGMRIVNSPNMLHQWSTKLPFGLACFSLNNREPMLLQDFSTDKSTLYVLDATEIAAFRDYLKNG